MRATLLTIGVCLAAVALAAAAPSVRGQRAPDPGEALFQQCYACHSVDPAETKLPGPNLAGVVGRRAAALSSFRYSPAMRAAGRNGLVWDRATLDLFLADPERAVPGTEMSYVGLKRAADRQALIAYLERAGRTRR